MIRLQNNICSMIRLTTEYLLERKNLPVHGPRREKTCLQGFPQSEIQTSLVSYRD